MRKYIVIAVISIILIAIFAIVLLQMGQTKNLSIYVNMIEKTVYIEDLKTEKQKEYKIKEEEVPKIKAVMEEYKETIEKDITKYYPEEEGTEELIIKWQLTYMTEEEENAYRYGGVLIYPEKWENFIEILKEQVSQ